MTDRVDKNWQKTGLTSYSIEALLGTLAHYGAQVDEAKFKEQAKDAYPLGIASKWHSGGWKGTGQFARYPFAAAQELWKRWMKERLLPSEFAEVAGKLVLALSQLLARKQDAPVDAAFSDFEALKPRIPVKDGGAEEAFINECFALLGEQMMKAFDELAERLAGEGHPEVAKRFAAVEEFLIPTREGVVSAVVRGASGDRDGAISDLEALAKDGGKDGYGRLAAIDGLIHFGSDKARGHAEALLGEAEQKQDHHLAMGIINRLVHLMEKTSDAASMKQLAERAQKIHDAHRVAHPDHAH